MARMHSRKRGKSGSTNSVSKVAPRWVKYKSDEVEKLVVKLSKEGKSTSEIGIILRDSYGIPNVKIITNKKINKILEGNNLISNVPEDLRNLMTRVIAVMKHLEKNRKDKTAKRGLQLTESKIRRLVKYYKNSGRLPKEWKYSRDKINLLLK